jgi:hypothetical protein
MEVRGGVTDRAWGMTLAAIGARRHTGQLVVDADGKRYQIAFADGAIVAATSPMAADAIVRVALTNHFITSTQVADLTRRLGLAADRDEVDVLADAVRFSPEQVHKLRLRLVAQRAARTFSLERGEFVLDDRIALPVYPGVAVDHRYAIYLGVRTNLSEQRLLDDLRQLGNFFALRPEVVEDLPRFGFEPAAKPVLEALQRGTSLPELEATNRELDPRFAQAIIYALAACNACVIQARTVSRSMDEARSLAPRNVTPRATAKLTPPAGMTAPPTGALPPAQPGPATGKLAAQAGPATGKLAAQAGPATGKLAAQPEPAASPPAATPTPPAGTRAQTPTARPGAATTPPTGSRTMTSPFAAGASASSYSAAPSDAGTNTPAATRARPPSTPMPRTTTPQPQPPPPSAPVPVPRTVPAAEVPATGRADTQDAVRFTDVPTPSPLPAAIKSAATFSEPRPRSPTAGRPAISRAMTPTELAGFADQRTPSGLLPGFGEQRTPGFGDQRTPPDQRTPGSGPTPSRVSTDNALAAEEAFKRGELAMKRDQPGEAILEFKTACDLNPQDVDFSAMLAWAKFCAAGDKAAIGADTRKILERAVFRSAKPERARFYLGRVERMLGRDKEALRHFQEVLELKPNHAEAASEVRAIEARAAATKGGTGLFGRKR